MTIGIDQPISGSLSAYGLGEVNGAKYAASVVNRDHLLGKGVTLKLDIRDDEGSKGQAVVNANAIASGSDVAMFGPVQASSASATTALAGNRMLTVLTQADSVLLNGSDPYVYNLSPTGISSFTGLAAYLKSKGVTTLAFVYDPSVASQPGLMAATKPILANYGIRVTQQVPVDGTQPQFTAAMNALAATHVSSIDILITNVTAVMLRELQADGYRGIEATYSGPASLFAPAGSAADGLVQPVLFTTLKAVNGPGAAFMSGYRTFAGEQASSYNAESYDAIMFIVESIRRAGSTGRVAVATAASKISQAGFTGVQGQYTFTDPAYSNRRANLPSLLLVYGPNGLPASVITPTA